MCDNDFDTNGHPCMCAYQSSESIWFPYYVVGELKSDIIMSCGIAITIKGFAHV